MEIWWSIVFGRALRCLNTGKGLSRVDFERIYRRIYPLSVYSTSTKESGIEFERTQVYNTGSFDFGDLLYLLCQEGYCSTTLGEENFPTLYFITEKGKEKISKKK